MDMVAREADAGKAGSTGCGRGTGVKYDRRRLCHMSAADTAVARGRPSASFQSRLGQGAACTLALPSPLEARPSPCPVPGRRDPLPALSLEGETLSLPSPWKGISV